MEYWYAPTKEMVKHGFRWEALGEALTEATLLRVQRLNDKWERIQIREGRKSQKRTRISCLPR
jgi:hypothetical protein